MTPNQAKIVIKNPCSENWDEMKADSDGRFCQSCQKSVIDFTSKTDLEIKAFLKDKQEENLCGRFYLHQVNRIRIEIDQNILVSDIPFWQKFLVVFLVCFGADFLGYDFVFAQTDSIPVKTEQVDSLVSILPVQADSTLEVSIDSVQKLIEVKLPETEQIFTIDPQLLMISGMMMVVDQQQLHPEWQIPQTPILLENPGVPQIVGTILSKTAPKRRRRKPTLPENAIIASADGRRKTRKS
jgi:hypothetical protein